MAGRGSHEVRKDRRQYDWFGESGNGFWNQHSSYPVDAMDHVWCVADNDPWWRVWFDWDHTPRDMGTGTKSKSEEKGRRNSTSTVELRAFVDPLSHSRVTYNFIHMPS
jgi:hypothetical protein